MGAKLGGISGCMCMYGIRVGTICIPICFSPLHHILATHWPLLPCHYHFSFMRETIECTLINLFYTIATNFLIMHFHKPHSFQLLLLNNAFRYMYGWTPSKILRSSCNLDEFLVPMLLWNWKSVRWYVTWTPERSKDQNRHSVLEHKNAVSSVQHD